MANFKVTLAYDGTNYSGFQRQKNAISVQEELEKALEAIYGKKTKVTGAGRTDSGVHAKGQVVNFYADDRVSATAIPLALKSLLPRDIVAYDCRRVTEKFHAQVDAKCKEYCYTIDNNRFYDVFQHRYAYHLYQKLRVKDMQKAASFLSGEHDFSSFRASNSTIKGNVRKMQEIKIYREDNLIKMHFVADGFLYKMVRTMVGTILLVGKGKLPPEEMAAILQSRNRDSAGPTAPPYGLCLERVYY